MSMDTFDTSSLPGDTRTWLREKALADGFESISAFLRDLICRLQRFEAEDDEEIRREVAVGLKELDRGEGAPGDKIFAELRAEHVRRFGEEQGQG